MNKNCVITVATHGYLHRAFALVESVFAHNSDCDFLILAPDLSRKKIRSVTWPVAASVKIIGLDDIENPLMRKMHQYFDPLELCSAAKPCLLEEALFKYGYEKAIMLDSDILCHSPLDRAESALNKFNMAVTPHVNFPCPEDGCLPDDREIANVGFINAGFWAVRKNDSTRNIILWAMDKVAHFGFYMPHIGLHAEQTWISCLPWFFPNDTVVLKDPGLNVAYWNLHERQLSVENGEYLCNGEKLVFFHYSGYDEKNPNRLTMHTKRKFAPETEIVLSVLLRDYGARLAAAKKDIPPLEPDLPCCNLSLENRIKLYRELYGKEAKFSAGPGKRPLMERAYGRLKKAVTLARHSI